MATCVAHGLASTYSVFQIPCTRRQSGHEREQAMDGSVGELTDARTRLREDGWCVVPGVLSADETAKALERLWAAADESEQRGLRTHMPALDPNAHNVRVFNLLDIDALFRDLIRHPTALGLVRSLLGEEFLISNFTANIARPGAR